MPESAQRDPRNEPGWTDRSSAPNATTLTNSSCSISPTTLYTSPSRPFLILGSSRGANWVASNDRVVSAPPPGEREASKAAADRLSMRERLRGEIFAEWVQQHRPAGQSPFADSSTMASRGYRTGPIRPRRRSSRRLASVAAIWIADDGARRPGAKWFPGTSGRRRSGDRRLSTRDVSCGHRKRQERGSKSPSTLVTSGIATPLQGGTIAYVIAAHDFDDSSLSPAAISGGWQPGGATSVHLAIIQVPTPNPGHDESTGYQAGRTMVSAPAPAPMNSPWNIHGRRSRRRFAETGHGDPPGSAFEYCCGA